MRKSILLVATFIISLFVFIGCTIFTSSLKQTNQTSGDYVQVYFGCRSSENDSSSRKAMADYSLSTFVYALTAKEEGSADVIPVIPSAEEIASGNNYVEIEKITAGTTIAPKTYSFTLTAYDRTTKAECLTATSPLVNLANGYDYVEFIMVPVTGKKGSARITLDFPNKAVIETVEAYITTAVNPIAESGTMEITKTKNEFTLLGSSEVHAGSNRVVFDYEELDSGINQFVYIKLKDAQGSVIASRLESIEIINGKQAVSNLYIADDGLRTYAVSLPLKLDGLGGELKFLDVYFVNGSKIYPLYDNGYGVLVGSIADANYDIIIKDRDLPKTYDTLMDYSIGTDNVTELNFITAKIPTDQGLTYEFVSGGMPVYFDKDGNPAKDEDGNFDFYVLNNSTLQLKAELSPGYNSASVQVIVDNSSNTIFNPNDSKQDILDIPVVNHSPMISVKNLTANKYSIEYNLDGGSWRTGGLAAAPKEYTVQDEVILPKYTYLSKVTEENGTSTTWDFDGWEYGDESNPVRIAKIAKGTTGNLSLKAVWKKGIQVSKPEEGEEPPEWEGEDITDPNNFTIAPSIFASGYSLIVKWSDEVNGTGETQIWIDYNSNGEIDPDDKQVVGAYNLETGEYDSTDFSGYKLEARNKDGTLPAADFTYTIRGGILATVKGLGCNAKNTSTVNISGMNTVIGNGHLAKDENGNSTGIDVIGIDLETITQEWITIDGQLSGDYHITMETAYKFSQKEPLHKVAKIENTSYAQTSKFICINKQDKSEQILSYMDLNNGDSKYTVIYLRNPNAVSLPTKGVSTENGGIVIDKTFDNSDIPEEFHLGPGAEVSQSCSVFSVYVENGTFVLSQTKMYSNGAEVATMNLGQTSETTYDDKLETDVPYIYMHMFSEENMITKQSATEFLRTIKFKKNNADTDIKVTIHLESVPYGDIQEFKNKYFMKYRVAKSTNFFGTTYEDFDNNEVFSYYNGSFYLGIKLKTKASDPYGNFVVDNYSSYVNWDTAYNEAKKIVFNGMNGYLINITSRVENNYIYKRMHLGQSWTGGARLDNRTDFDSMTYTMPGDITLDTTFRWQAGPEAGMKFTTGTIPEVKVKLGDYITEGKYFSGTYSSKSFTSSSSLSSFNTGEKVYLIGSDFKILATAQINAVKNTSVTLKSLSSSSLSGVSYLAKQSEVTKTTKEVTKQDSGNKKYKTTATFGYTNWNNNGSEMEPNDSHNGLSEQCVHFLENGEWNDYSYNYESVTGFIVEFTPYQTIWNEETGQFDKTPAQASKSNYPSLTISETY